MGEFTYQPKWDPIGFDNRSQIFCDLEDPSKPDCGSARAGYVAGDASRCQQERRGEAT